jgi:hypothetical protein
MYSGTVSLSGNNIILTDAEVYTEAPAVAFYSAIASAGGVSFDASGSISITGDSSVYAYAQASGYDGYPEIATAAVGDLSMIAGGNIIIDINDNGDFPAIRAYAYSGGDFPDYGDMTFDASGSGGADYANIDINCRLAANDLKVIARNGWIRLDTGDDIRAMGDITVQAADDIRLYDSLISGDSIYLLADCHQASGYTYSDGIGDLIIASYEHSMVADYFTIQGANSLAISVAVGANAVIYDPEVVESPAMFLNPATGDNLLGLSVTSTNGGVSFDAEEGSYYVAGDIRLAAAGNVWVYSSLAAANNMYLLADAGYYDGLGELNLSDGIRLTANGHYFQGANEFIVDEGSDGYYYLSLNDRETTVELAGPGQNTVPATLSIYNTSEDALTVYSLEPRQSISLISNGDLNIYTDITADSLTLIADNNYFDGGDLNSEGGVVLTGTNFYFRAARNFDISSDAVSYNDGAGNELFSASLVPGSLSSLGTLDISSTEGTVTVSGAIVRGDSGIVRLHGDAGVYLDAPITVGLASLEIVSYNGSIAVGSDVAGPCLTAGGYVYLRSGSYSYDPYGQVYSQTSIGSLEQPLDIMITGYGYIWVDAEGVIDGVSGVLTGTTPTNEITIYNEPQGIVYFNNAPINVEPPQPPEPPIVPEPGPGPSPEPLTGPIAPVGDIQANQPNPVNPGDLNSYQFSSTIGTVFLYHPVVPTDMAALDQFALSADSYQLRDGQLQLVGHEGLLQFFQEFDQKKKQGSL